MGPGPEGTGTGGTGFRGLHWGPITQISYGLVLLGRESSYEHLLHARNTMVSTRALEAAYLYEFWTLLVMEVWGPFFAATFGVRRYLWR